MHLSFIANRLNVSAGGSDLSLDLLGRKLSERGHNVEIHTVNTTAPNEIEGTIPYSVESHPVGEDASRLEIARSVYQLFDDNEADTDLFHIFNPPFITIGGLYRWRGGATPVIGRLNNYTVFCTNTSLMDGDCHKNCTVLDKFKHDPRELISRLARSPTYLTRSTVEPTLINQVDRLFAISPTIRDIYEMNGLSAEIIDVVPNFYDPTFNMVKEDTGKEYNGEKTLESTTDECRLLYVGRITWTKGVDILVDAIAEADSGNVVLDIVGDGELRNSVESRAVKAGLKDQLQFHGWLDHDELRSYYKRASVFIHPGRWPEPFGRTIIEAMQHGCVPVVTDTGAPPWIIGDAGVTVPKDDREALAAVITELALDPERRQNLGFAAKQRVEQFAPNRVLSMIENRYSEVLKIR